MAGLGLVAIKRRIKSVEKTRKITKAMGLVATSKIRKSKDVLTANTHYFDEFGEVFTSVVSAAEEKNIYLDGNGSNKKLIIILTSDTGLCGSYNSSVVNFTLGQLRKDKSETVLITVGKKGKSYFNKYNVETAAEYVDIGDVPSIKESKTIANHALTLYREGKIGSIDIVYTKYVSSINQAVQMDRILPLKKVEGIKSSFEFEKSADEMINELAASYMSQLILHDILESKVSEQSSRMTAMDGATKNADDIIDKLNLSYNRIRQSVITAEISEIVGGAEAQR